MNSIRLHSTLEATVAPVAARGQGKASENLAPLARKLAELTPSLKSSRPRNPQPRSGIIPSRIASQQQQQQQQRQLTPSSLKEFPGHLRSSFNVKTLMAANMHLGHSPEVWNPYTLPYIYGERGGVQIINLEHTLVALRRAINVTKEVAMQGGNVVFVGSKPKLHRIVVKAAKEGDAYFVTKWVGGTISNRERVLRRSVGYDPDKVTQDMQDPLGRKEFGKKRKGETGDEEEPPVPTPPKRQPFVRQPDLLVIFDLPNNLVAVREANAWNIPVIALVDSDTDPNLVQYPIPANDDSQASLELVAGLLSRASAEGQQVRTKTKNT